ncbi:MAG: glycosyltransferase family 39 protein [Patescibacteria group bacterium]|nr:glycosyltransferase family 39 protein [Patescibacteria group bacterium]
MLKRLFKDKYFLAFLGIIALAVFFRFFKLSSLPPGLHPDEAANGLDIIGILEKGKQSVFFATNGPREALFFYLQAIGVLLFGYTTLGLRFMASFISVASIIATYFLAKELFGKRVGLLSAFAMTVIPWYLVISRDGFRANMTPLFVSLTLFFAIKAYRERKTLYFILFGLSLGLGFHTYLAYRLFPAVFIALVGFFILFKRDFFRNLFVMKKELIYSGLSFSLVLLPLVLYFIRHPEDAGARASGTSILNKNLNGGNPIGFLLENLKKTALMFNYQGDLNFRQNLGGAPMLDPLGGIAFIGGFVYSIRKIFKWEYFLILAIFGVMLLPMVLTAEGIPHGLRSIGIVPSVAIMIALFIDFIWRRWELDFKQKAVKYLGIATFTGFILFSIAYGYIRYFEVWGKNSDTYEAYAEDMVILAGKINSESKSANIVTVIGEYSDKTVQYLTHDRGTYQRFEPRDADKIQLKKGENYVYIQRDMIDEAEDKLWTKYINGRFTSINSTFDSRPLLYLFEVKL